MSILGDLDGFALELANWLVSRGATKLVLASHTSKQTGYQSLMIRRWTDRGVDVSINTCDMTTLKGARNLIVAAKQLSPIGGIFDLTAVRCDGSLVNQTENHFKSAVLPKIDVTKHLDALSRVLCPNLDCFICFSSVPCGCGNAGQSLSGLASSAIERICEQRQLDGLPGTCIQCGAVYKDGTSMVTDLDINLSNKEANTDGINLQQSIRSCLQAIDVAMQKKLHALLSSVLLGNRNLS